eukprot:5719562-Prymnesium_polylepis.2
MFRRSGLLPCRDGGRGPVTGMHGGFRCRSHSAPRRAPHSGTAPRNLPAMAPRREQQPPAEQQSLAAPAGQSAQPAGAAGRHRTSAVAPCRGSSQGRTRRS